MMKLIEMNKQLRGGFNLDLYGKQTGFDGSGDSTLKKLLEELMINSGMNHIVQLNDCETSGDWTESDNGTLDYAVGATGKRVGTNCLAITNTAATDDTQYIQTLLVNESATPSKNVEGDAEIDISDCDYIGFWKHAASSAHFGTDGELKFAIVNDGVVNPIDGVEQDHFDVDGTAGTEHHWCQIDISAYDRTKVSAIRFYGENANTAEVCYIDDIIRYKFQYNGGPLYGSYCPIKSATTLTENDTVQWTIDGLIKSTSAANVADLGPVHLGAATKLGTALRAVWGKVPYMFLFLVQANAATIAGEGLEWAANGLYAGVSTTVDENAVAKGLEAAGAQYDHIFAVGCYSPNFIS